MTDSDPPPELLPLTPESRHALSVDWSRYEQYLEDVDLPEAAKQEFLETLWSIIVTFVDLGFGIHPLQQICGEDEAVHGLSVFDLRNVIGSSHQITRIEFSNAVDDEGVDLEEGYES